MAVDDQIKAMIREGEFPITVRLMEIDPQRKQLFPAELDVGGICLCGSSLPGRVAQGQQKFPAAGINVQQDSFRCQRRPDNLFVVPGEILLLAVSAANRGEVPSMDLRGLLLPQPRFDQLVSLCNLPLDKSENTCIILYMNNCSYIHLFIYSMICREGKRWSESP